MVKRESSTLLSERPVLNNGFILNNTYNEPDLYENILDMSWIRTERWPSVTNKGPVADKIKESPKEVEHNLISVKKKPKKIKTIGDKAA